MKLKNLKPPNFVKINLSGKSKGGSRAGQQDDATGVGGIPPNNSVTSLDGRTLAGDDTNLRSGLSTIPGSTPNTLLEEEEEEEESVSDSKGLASNTNPLQGTGTTTTIGQELKVKDNSFIGADGKLYTPSKVEGDFSLQEIPPPAGASAKKTSTKKTKRVSSARPKKIVPSLKPKPNIKTGLGRDSRPTGLHDSKDTTSCSGSLDDGNSDGDKDDDESGLSRTGSTEVNSTGDSRQTRLA